MERLHAEGVTTVYVGALTDVLGTNWSVRANAKTHNFWAFPAFIDRLETTAEEFGIEVEERSEAWTSQECPQCGSTHWTSRHRDTLACECGFEGHADLVASKTFLQRHTKTKRFRPMARPVRYEWDSHEWLESLRSPVRVSPKVARTNPKVTFAGRASVPETPAKESHDFSCGRMSRRGTRSGATTGNRISAVQPPPARRSSTSPPASFSNRSPSRVITADRLAETGPMRESINVVPNGIDVDCIQSAPLHETHGHDAYDVLFAGRLIEDKKRHATARCVQCGGRPR